MIHPVLSIVERTDSPKGGFLVKLYETGLIFDPQLDDAGFDAEIKKVTDIIESNSGQIEKVDRWGIRKLAYLIKKRPQGYYTFIYHNSPPNVPQLLEAMLRIDENCLRYMTIVPDYKVDLNKDTAPRPAHAERAPRVERNPEPEDSSEDNDSSDNDEDNE